MAAKNPKTLTIDAVSDLVCPWCYLGKKRLESALGNVAGPVLIRWHPFELNPDVPVGGMPLDEYLDSRFGGREVVEPALEQLAVLGSGNGIAFDFDRIERVPNTLNAHRLIRYAHASGRQNVLIDLLFRGFFEEGRDIGDPEVLSKLAADAGLKEQKIRQLLGGNEMAKEIRNEQARARELGIIGVPNYIVNNRFAVSGAQDPDSFLEAFDRAMFGTGRAMSRVLH